MKFGYANIDGYKLDRETQVEELSSYGVDEIYIDEWNTSLVPQKSLSEALDRLHAGDTLVVWRLDALGRTIKQFISLIEGFRKRGIDFVSIDDGIDTTNDECLFKVITALKGMERNIISARTKNGMTKKGKVGRPSVDQKKIEEAIDLYYSNLLTIDEILHKTEISRSTLYKYLRTHKKENGDG